MSKITIVSASSDKYFHLFLELIDSIKKFKKSKNIDICLINYNLSKTNLEIVKKKVDQITEVKKFLSTNK